MRLANLYLFMFVCITTCPAMAADEILCEPGYYRNNNECMRPPLGAVSPGGDSESYTWCVWTQYASADQSECISCPPEYPYTNYGRTSIEGCFDICMGGTYKESVSATECTNVATDEWAPLHMYYYGHDYKTDNTLHKCPGQQKTLGHLGYGADDETDCAHVLHIGDASIRLVGKKKTSPALAASINGATYYAKMSAVKYPMSMATGKTLNTEMNNTHYYIYDDTVPDRDAYPWESPDFDWAEQGSYTFDTTNQTWTVYFKNSTWSGLAQCQDELCSCKMLSPAITEWWDGKPVNGSECMDRCALECGWSFAHGPVYKKLLLENLIE